MEEIIDCLLIGYRDGEIDCNLEKIKVNDEKDFNAAIAYLGTFLSRKGFTFEYVNYIEDEYSLLFDILTNKNIMSIGVSTTFCPNWESVIKIIKSIRRIRSDVKIIAGGTYIAKLIKDTADTDTRVLSHLLKLMDADFYINSFQGEATLVNLLSFLKNKLPINDIANIYYRSENGFKYTKTIIEDNNLEENMVNWSLFSNRMRKIIPVRTAISCPFHCAYCSHKINVGDYKYVSVEAVERELDSICKDDNVTIIHFVDDTFNVPINRFKDILRLMIRKKYGFNWYSFLRCQYLDIEAVELMKESNCTAALLGIESGSQRMLNIMNKQATIDELRNGILLLHKYRIMTHGMFIIGFPGETDETIKETVDFINNMNFTSISIEPWYYEINTPITEKKMYMKLPGSIMIGNIILWIIILQKNISIKCQYFLKIKIQ